MAISPLSSSSALIQNLQTSREQLFDLHRQLGTGKIAESYGGLDGTARLTILSLRAQTSSIGGYQRVINNVDTQLRVALQTVERFSEIDQFTKTDFFNSAFNLVDGQQTTPQRSAKTSLDEVVALLNSEVNGRYFFGGLDSGNKPVASIDHILNGDGARAGLTQLIAERRDADLGSDGRGRVDINLAGATVDLSEEAAGLPFGMKVANVSSTFPSGQVTGPTGSPQAVSVAFGSPLPVDGDTVTFSFTLPDGSEDSFTLTARDAGPLVDGEFLLGADATATATNFESALGAETERFAATKLEAASAIAGSRDFFAGSNTNPPQRVDGPPFDTATGFVAGTAADTVVWYTGDDSANPARDAAKARIDDSVTIAYGTRADEEGIVNLLENLGVLAATTFSETDPNHADKYQALWQRTGAALDFPPGNQSPADIVADLAVAARTLEITSDRHDVALNLAETLISEREDADIELVSVQILSLQTRLQASLQATSLISRLSLVNFI